MTIPTLRAARRIGVASLVAAAALLAGAGPAAAAPSSQDTTYLTTNAQTSLAEITIGNLALERGVSADVKDLANMTLTDHTAALAKVTGVLTDLGLPVPTEPTAEQKADAAKLQGLTGADFDLAYAQIQVAGHQKSVSSTDTEISSGSDPAAIAYAQGYRPVAAMHLQMAEDALAALGGSPTGVPAGTGGMAASSSAVGIWLTVAGVLALLAAGLVVRFRPRRTATH
jgi:putative membrane protein